MMQSLPEYIDTDDVRAPTTNPDATLSIIYSGMTLLGGL